jgi:hypothetical protein
LIDEVDEGEERENEIGNERANLHKEKVQHVDHPPRHLNTHKGTLELEGSYQL